MTSKFKSLWALLGAGAAVAISIATVAKLYWFEADSRGVTAINRLLRGRMEVGEAFYYFGFPSIGVAVVAWQLFKLIEADRPFGGIAEGVKNGLPSLSWSQESGSNQTAGDAMTKGLWQVYGALIVGAALIGYFSGTSSDAWANAIFGAIVGALAGAAGVGEGLKRYQDRSFSATPLLRQEDCEAFIEFVGGEYWFCVARGDNRSGALPVVERVPWASFSNFEEGSNSQWFRVRGSTSELADWGVIIAQSTVGRVVKVAESINGHATLIELLVQLQNLFVMPRDATLRRLREAERGNLPKSTQSSVKVTAENDVPIRRF
jgi:hypothetical protein